MLYTGIPDWPRRGTRQAAEPLVVKGVETGLMPAMDEGTFILDYIAPTGTPLERTEEMARSIEQILLENPDVEVYVRRTGTQMGMFATKTNRGDIQVILRPAEDDPIEPADQAGPPAVRRDRKGDDGRGKRRPPRSMAHSSPRNRRKKARPLSAGSIAGGR